MQRIEEYSLGLSTRGDSMEAAWRALCWTDRFGVESISRGVAGIDAGRNREVLAFGPGGIDSNLQQVFARK